MRLASAWLPAAMLLASAATASAHGIAGNRFFPGTMSFDDPAVADELTLPSVSSFRRRLPDVQEVRDTSIPASFARLLTPTVAVGADAAWDWHDQPGQAPRSGFGPTHLVVKRLLYRDDPRETLVSAALGWGVRGIGTTELGAHTSNTLEPALTFGKGLGDLPDGARWLRPFGVAGSVAPELPTAGSAGDIVRWGAALEYSTLYLTDRFVPGVLPKEEPLHQLVPLVEFAFVTPRSRAAGRTTTGTMDPGLSYVAQTWQLSAAAIVPLNRSTGRSAGFQAQLLFFLDDLLPSVFEKPLLATR